MELPLIALMAGAGAIWLQPDYWRATTRYFDHSSTGALQAANQSLPGDRLWLASLAIYTLLLASALTMRTKME